MNGDGARGEPGWDPWGSRQSPLLTQGLPHTQSSRSTATVLPLPSSSLRLCRRVPGSLLPVPGTHMLDWSLGFPISTSGLKATEPLREGPAACRDADTGDCGVDAPATARPG